MDKSTREHAKNQLLFQCLMNIKDPRVKARCTYPLINILFVTTCALISGFDTWEGIARFTQERSRWLGRYVDMSPGVPSPLTFARIFSLIDPKEFQTCLRQWMNQFFKMVKYDLIHFDGKSLKGSSIKRGNKKAAHIVNAYLSS